MPRSSKHILPLSGQSLLRHLLTWPPPFSPCDLSGSTASLPSRSWPAHARAPTTASHLCPSRRRLDTSWQSASRAAPASARARPASAAPAPGIAAPPRLTARARTARLPLAAARAMRGGCLDLDRRACIFVVLVLYLSTSFHLSIPLLSSSCIRIVRLLECQSFQSCAWTSCQRPPLRFPPSLPMCRLFLHRPPFLYLPSSWSCTIPTHHLNGRPDRRRTRCD